MKHCHYITQINMVRKIESEIAHWQFKLADDPIWSMSDYIAIVNYGLSGSRKMTFNSITPEK